MTTAVLSIQSRVAAGHVGLDAATLGLQRQGCEVIGVPTCLLAHHPGHGKPFGRVLAADEVAGLLMSLERGGWLEPVAGAVSGWLGSADNGRAVLNTIARLKARRQGALFLCDPVMGDDGPGLYVQAELPGFFRDAAVPMADVLTPNHFELERLAGRSCADAAALVRAARALIGRGPRGVVVTSSRVLGDAARHVALVVTAAQAWTVAVPAVDRPPNGVGDLFAALLAARLLKDEALPAAAAFAASAVHGVIAGATGAREMPLVARQAALADPVPVAEVADLA